jgi:very-short-patch-repair endonuclease
MSLRITSSAEIDRLIAKGAISKDKVPLVKKAIKSSRKSQPKNDSEEKLFQLLLPIYGDYFDDKDGQLVKELKVFPDRKFRLDVTLARSRLVCEVDGIIGHSTFFNPKTQQNVPNLDGFKRDRTRDMMLITKGWLTIRCMRHHIINEPQLILDAVAALVAKQKVLPINISRDHGKYPILIE